MALGLLRKIEFLFRNKNKCISHHLKSGVLIDIITLHTNYQTLERNFIILPVKTR